MNADSSPLRVIRSVHFRFVVRTALVARQCALGGLSLAIAGTALMSADARAALSQMDSLNDHPIEQFNNNEITSVSKRAERLADAPASVFIITGADLRRSG